MDGHPEGHGISPFWLKVKTIPPNAGSRKTQRGLVSNRDFGEIAERSRPGTWGVYSRNLARRGISVSSAHRSDFCANNDIGGVEKGPPIFSESGDDIPAPKAPLKRIQAKRSRS